MAIAKVEARVTRMEPRGVHAAGSHTKGTLISRELSKTKRCRQCEKSYYDVALNAWLCRSPHGREILKHIPGKACAFYKEKGDGKK